MTTESLRRYTTLPYLLDILKKKRLTLVDPEKWDDKNDSYFLKLYKEKLQFKSVLALCFAESPELYHHWKVYSGNTSGVCIEFLKSELLEECDANEGIRNEYVDYKRYDQLEENRINVCDLPFIKRVGFIDEDEFRLVYASKLKFYKTKYILIDLKCISRIIINPWVEKTVFNSIKTIINNMNGCNMIQIDKSTLTDSKRWQTIIQNNLNEKPSSSDCDHL